MIHAQYFKEKTSKTQVDIRTFTSEAAGSSLIENFLNATRTQSSCEKSKSQRSAESRGFPPGTPVSSHRES